jgi:MFS transporter, ACS family, aldohexuronate transporter
VFYLSPLYMNRVLHFTQAELGRVLWIPPLGWELGYFFWGWIFDHYAANQDRPIGMFLLLAGLALPFGLTGQTTSSVLVLVLFFWCMFVTGGFQMLGLRTGARAYPGERTASVAGVASGSWAAEAAIILPITGHWFDHHQYNTVFWFIALGPLVGVLLWLLLSRGPSSDSNSPELGS